MANTKEQQLQAFARRAVRASKALWPTNARRAVATSRAAQTRRQLIVKSHFGRWPSLSRSGEGQGRPPGSSPHSTRKKEQGRPPGSPPLFHSSPAPTMNAVGIFVLTGTGVVFLSLMHLWLLLILFIAALLAMFLLLVLMRRRKASIKSTPHGSLSGAERKSFPGVLGRGHSPNTPMPLEPPLVRVLETFDLSQSDVEHFLDLPDAGNTGGYSLESWKAAQMK